AGSALGSRRRGGAAHPGGRTAGILAGPRRYAVGLNAATGHAQATPGPVGFEAAARANVVELARQVEIAGLLRPGSGDLFAVSEPGFAVLGWGRRVFPRRPAPVDAGFRGVDI